jgi:hypothetical protein
MAVLGRLLVSSAERLDLPDFLSIDSYAQGDFKYLMKSFVGSDRPYILTGFDVINPGASIGTQSMSIRVADSIAYYPGSLAGPFFHGLPEGNPQSTALIPELRKNATNYVYLTFTTVEAAKDTRAFWDPDKNNGEGGEFTQDVNTESVLTVDVNVSVSSFPENTIPVCTVVMGPNSIESIEDARDMMFRLGTGGLNPNPLGRYNFRQEPTASNARLEPNTYMSNVLDPNAFQGGDKNIESLKEWMDVVMTKIVELSGSTFWYEDVSTFSVTNLFKDALGSTIKSKGEWRNSNATPGLITWTEDIVYQLVADKRDILIRSGSKLLANNQVAYVEQIRDKEFNTGNIDVEWFSASNIVNGPLGSFENLSKGDWVKQAGDPDYRYLRVEEFYANTNLAGGITVPSNALSIKLSENYTGMSGLNKGIYAKGEYNNLDVVVEDRSAQNLTDIGGNLNWLAMRSDTIMSIADITGTQLTLDITQHDGLTAKVESTGHGLNDGERITITGSVNFDGTYLVEVESADVFYINLVSGPFPDEIAVVGYYAVVTTGTTFTTDGFQLESANHGFDTNQTIFITDTTNYNDSYEIYVRSATEFSIAIPGFIANETSGTATLVKILAKTDFGPTTLTPGENLPIGGADTRNIMNFIGMESQDQESPIYNVPVDYNTLDGQANYNSSLDDNLTDRASKLTSMCYKWLISRLNIWLLYRCISGIRCIST